MTKDKLEGKWEDLKSQVKEKWGKITNDDLENIQGKKDQLVRKLRERYGFTHDKAKSEIEVFMKNCSC
jgi:uncharacterized protein YjbJ (UPF0337 family)